MIYRNKQARASRSGVNEPWNNLPPEIRDICQTFLNGLQATLGKKLFSVTIYGAAAFPDTFAIGDIDFHVIVKGDLSDGEKANIDQLHTVLKQKYPPLGGELDGYYLRLADTNSSTPPRSIMWKQAVDNSWALHCAHIRAGRCISLYGPPPAEIYPAVGWDDLEPALRGELEFVKAHLDQYPDYCILNLCRLIYSYKTRQVVISKAQAAKWAEAHLPEWGDLIQAARKSYMHQATTQDRNCMKDNVHRFFSDACNHINEEI